MYNVINIITYSYRFQMATSI